MAENVVRYYHYIDNGGHTVSVDDLGNVTIETGFYGYSWTTLMLSNEYDFLNKLVEALQTAQAKLAQK